MKHSSTIFFGLMMAVFSVLSGDDAIPQGIPAEHYESLWKRSPFSLSSAPTEAGSANVSAQFALAGVAKIAEDDMVVLVNKQSLERITLRTGMSVKGIRLVSVQSNKDPTRVTATIQVGEESNVVRFDPATLKAPAASTPSPGGNQTGMPVATTTPGGARGTTPGGAVGGNSSQQYAPAPAQGMVRRRLIVPSKPPSPNQP